MLRAAAERFGDDPRVELLEHDLVEPLPPLRALAPWCCVLLRDPSSGGRTQARALRRNPRCGSNRAGCSPTSSTSPPPSERLNLAFIAAIGETPEEADPSDRTLDVFTQVGWLRELGYEDADCHWKWREMALLAGRKPE